MRTDRLARVTAVSQEGVRAQARSTGTGPTNRKAVSPPDPSDPEVNGLKISTCRVHVSGFRKLGRWPLSLRPQPDQHGYRGPPELLEEFGITPPQMEPQLDFEGADRLGRANAIDWSRASIDSASFAAKRG